MIQYLKQFLAPPQMKQNMATLNSRKMMTEKSTAEIGFM